ncbi:MAG: hypothetical protein HY814_11315 [Candidatus Riflebacteria bacterium]|nr:hypothetical protein [Candidatus Riflebacteria bacterium]
MTIVLGGDASSGELGALMNDMWEWSGTNWDSVTTTLPTSRADAAMVFDSARGGLVLFGGVRPGGLVQDDTWEFRMEDGARAWRLRTPAQSPPPRRGHSLVYDPARGRSVLYGGTDASGYRLSDTWEWDGTTWAQRRPTRSPGPREGHGSWYDAEARRVVVFGGNGVTGGRVETAYEWDGANWTLSHPGDFLSMGLLIDGSYEGRARMACTYDLARRRAILCCGIGTDGTVSADTWERADRRWVLRQARALGQRRGASLVTDVRRNRVVLFGGLGSNGLASDTWEWNGSRWVERTPLPGAPNPPPRTGHAMACDQSRGEVVLFGGVGMDSTGGAQSIGGQWVLGDTWVWDGRGWMRRSPSAAPSRRYSAAMTYDTSRQRVLLFGGTQYEGSITGETSLNDTWEWSGSNWEARTPLSTSPPKRYGHSLTYDPVRGEAVLFGGWSRDFGGWTGTVAPRIWTADTWTWNGLDWNEEHPGTFPEGRRYHSTVFDPASGQKVILFGGDRDAPTGLTATWTWDGSSWAPAGSWPAEVSPRTQQAGSFDPVNNSVISFGGWSNRRPFGDVWLWRQSTWTQLATEPVVSPVLTVRDAAMCYDAARSKTVLFGGDTSGGVGTSETCEWDGTNWEDRTPGSLPLGFSPRMSHCLAFDPGRGREVLFGGRAKWNTSILKDTWECAGAQAGWADVTPAANPFAAAGLAGARMVYESAGARTLLF